MKYMAISIAIALILPSFSSLATEHNETIYYAILIGMNKNIPKIYEELLKWKNWKRENIICLYNKNATLNKIMDAFKEIENRSDRNDFVFILYSGKGKIVLDDNGDEKDGYDEAMITWDNLSIRDDFLEKEIDKINASGIAIFLDCDYSRGIEKDIEGSNRIIMASSYGILPFHICTSLLYNSLKHASSNQSFEEIIGNVKNKNNIFWASIPFLMAIFSTLAQSFLILFTDMSMNMVRSVMQAFDGFIGAIEPYFYTFFFFLTILIYLPFIFSINMAFISAIIMIYELFNLLAYKSPFAPIASLYDGYAGKMPFLVA